MTLSVLEAAAEAGGRVALVGEGRALTYRELAGLVRRAAVDLPRGGLLPIVPRRTVADVVALLAAIETGVPVLLVHPRASAIERERLVEAARAGRVEPGTEPDRTLAVVPTSGTTGRPRGVRLSRAAFVASAAASAANLGWREDDRWHLALPLAHVGGLSVLVRALVARRAVVLEPERSFEPVRHRQALEAGAATIGSVVPTQLARLVETGLEPPRRLRALLVGGAAASPALLRRAETAGWPVLPTYGLTEASSQVATRRPGCPVAGVGPPLPGIEVRIEGEEILVRGPTMLTGHHPPAGDPFRPGGWYATGDLGRFDEGGNLHVLGRRSERIVTGGENVDPGAVEAALLEYPGVVAACVVGLADPLWGEVVAAGIVAEELDLARLERALRERLAPHERPRRIRIVESLPIGAGGKVDRRRVRDALACRRGR